MGKNSHFLDYVAVGFTVFLITAVPLTSQYFVLYPWLSFNPRLRIERLLLLAPYNIGVLSFGVPIGYHPLHQSAVSLVERKKSSGGLRFCRKCNAFKAPRTHHCSECRTCVLKMDHHCPWLNNCVGFYNHGHFLRFTLSVGFSSSYCLFLFGLYLRHLIISQSPTLYQRPNFDRFYTPPPNNLTLVVMILNILTLFILLLSVGILSLWQLYYVACNTTTIESLENDKIEQLVKKGIINSNARYPYDLGSSIANIKTVLGPWILFWWVPGGVSMAAAGDGLSFPINPELLAEALKDGLDLSWPPEEYYDYKAGRIPVGSRSHGYRSSSRLDRSPSRRAIEEGTESARNRLIESTDDDDDDEDVDEGTTNRQHLLNESNHQQQHQNKYQRRRIVRRGSEGYIVRDSKTPFQAQRHKESSDSSRSSDSDTDGDVDDDDMPLVDLKSKRNL
ncbi:DHHC palmitoyltransferase-domain-containing protein [Obelidium mucronatum]|nr:DHHC palmitoyltransferase-domain-containing protein [Obelidium mucronatum]